MPSVKCAIRAFPGPAIWLQQNLKVRLRNGGPKGTFGCARRVFSVPVPAAASMAISTTIRVLCIEDDTDAVDMIDRLIRAEQDMETVGFLPRVDGLLHAIETRRPHVVILDVDAPGGGALERMKEALARFPNVRAVVHSGRAEPELCEQVIAHGGHELVVKSAGPLALLHAIRKAAVASTRSPVDKS